MTTTVSVTDMARRFAEYLNRIAFRGENFILVRGGKRIAELRPVPAGARLRDLPRLLAELPRLAEGDASDFARDLAAARRSLARVKQRDPWAS